MTRKHPAQELEEDVLVRTSNMGQGRSDYEAFHTLSPAIHLREIHTHDFFELYIHLNGFPRLYVDNKIVTPQRGSLMIFPPFVMHGIISQDTIRNYDPELAQKIIADQEAEIEEMQGLLASA